VTLAADTADRDRYRRLLAGASFAFAPLRANAIWSMSVIDCLTFYLQTAANLGATTSVRPRGPITATFQAPAAPLPAILTEQELTRARIPEAAGQAAPHPGRRHRPPDGRRVPPVPAGQPTTPPPVTPPPAVRRHHRAATTARSPT
jgi:hypothetical protein